MASPQLRFKEFDGNWSKYKIAETTEYLVDGTHFSPKSTEGEFKYITSKNIRNDGLDLSNLSYISKEEHQVIFKRCKVKFGDILLTKDGANTGNCCLNTLDEEFSLLSSVAVLRGKQGYFDNKFLLQILQSDLGQNTITSSMAGQAITRITLAKLKDYSFHFPLYKEQTKIASFLSAVDEKISQLTQKHELLSQYKQGMMQKLFSQQIRFKADDGREFGEWEEKLLSEVGSFKNGLNKDKESFGFGFPFINLMDVFGKKIVETKKLGLVDANQKDLENYDLKKGDVLFIRSSVKAEGVGQTALVTDDLPNTVYSGFLIRFRDSYGLNLGFKKYCFMNNDFRLRLLAKSTTSANTNINQESLSALSIKIPCLAEQTKIANFLSSLDEKIEVVVQQIEQAKQWKKGLLQQMFV